MKVVGDVNVATSYEELRETYDSDLKKWESETLKIGVIGASGTGNQECFELENKYFLYVYIFQGNHRSSMPSEDSLTTARDQGRRSIHRLRTLERLKRL